MRTIALALFAAAANADAAADALTHDLCDGYLWGLEVADWTCEADADVATTWTCENGTDAALLSTTVDSTSAAWKLMCTLDDGTLISPEQIVGTEALCTAYEEAKVAADADWVLTDAEKATIEWVTACGGLGGASALTAFGAAVVAAFAALAF